MNVCLYGYFTDPKIENIRKKENITITKENRVITKLHHLNFTV